MICKLALSVEMASQAQDRQETISSFGSQFWAAQTNVYRIGRDFTFGSNRTRGFSYSPIPRAPSRVGVSGVTPER
jgi:hypothetical protein